MDDITTEQIQARLPSLPQEIRDILSDPLTFEKISVVGNKHGLTKVEIGLLAQVTSVLMMGFFKPNDYVSIIADYTGITREEAAFIAQEINRDIFNQIKDSLKLVHSINAQGAHQTVIATPKPVLTQMVHPSPYQVPTSLHQPNPSAPTTPTTPSATPTPPRVPTRPITPPMATPPPLPSNILEQKLGGAFRMKSEEVTYNPTNSVSQTQPVNIPPAPLLQRPSATPPPTGTPPIDPYREIV